ncbi:MAG: 2-oxoglutarate/2-oxoacid ferredoxin oxidoreductase subunit alpha [Acidobacteriota bacterium]|jgi:2-oxoglutarate ferredoxin oxidoreductase subunit alpha|nr:2-oxoglutarate/2-oxoacid ferredoxin oxidoreductase subunit alpha [Acidobacteriota bacterium]
MKNEVTLSIVGSGGDGAVVAGDLVAMACAGRGLHVIKTEAYGPQIRGGESSCTIRIGTAPLFAQADAIDALVVFRFADFARFRSEIALVDRCLVLHEPDDAPPDVLTSTGATFISVPFAQLAKDAGAPAAKNIIALGLLSAIFGLPLDGLRGALRKRFAKKAATVVDANLRALDAGIAHAATLNVDVAKLAEHSEPPRLLMSGNEAAAYGAMHAGCTFFAGYPITPSSEILHLLSEWLPKSGGSCVQTEDELSAIGAVVGASFAGAKAMTSTSGPGLSLMSEILGLSSIAEIPSVIVNVQRGGPSTGLPTKSEQSDLAHALYGSHGDTPRVVLAPCDVEDAFHCTVEAFNIAEEFQLPVIVLSDQLIAQRRETIESSSLVHDVADRRVAVLREGEDYRRYAETPDGVSPMAIPGMRGATYQTNGLEHDERGRPASLFIVHEQMNAKRYRKLDAVAQRYPLFRRFGSEQPELGILCWGSSSGPVREAIAEMNAGGARIAAFVPRILAPLPAAELQSFIDSCERILVIELSYSAQFHHYLRSIVDLPRQRTDVLSRSGGKSLSVSEVIRAATRLVRAETLREVLA